MSALIRVDSVQTRAGHVGRVWVGDVIVHEGEPTIYRHQAQADATSDLASVFRTLFEALQARYEQENAEAPE